MTRNDAEPGKILHETRSCEMAVLGEVPFGHYYGSVDSTPLFVLLAARYFERTGDKDTIRALWPNIEAALDWIDKYGDHDGDGFVEYYRVSENGLTNQGWKDSQDSIMHADGTLATGPIALCEVQGYVYRRQAGRGEAGRDAGLSLPAPTSWPRRRKSCASRSRRNSGSRSWAPMPSRWMATSSPAGWSAPMPARCWSAAWPRRNGRRQLAATLMTPEMFSGWGIRTLVGGWRRASIP